MVKEFIEGVNGILIKCGVIGEIGCLWLLILVERKFLLVVVVV